MSIYYILQNLNHLRLGLESAIELRDRGHRVDLIDLEQIGLIGVAKECETAGYPSYPIDWLLQNLSKNDVVLAGCDWAPRYSPYLDLLVRIRSRGPAFACIVEGAGWTRSDQYRLAEYVLAYGPAVSPVYRSRAYPPRIYVVGS